MSRVGMVIACILGGLMLFWFAGTMALNKIPGWGWFLLAGCAVWGTGINVFTGEEREWSKHPMGDSIDLFPDSPSKDAKESITPGG